MRRPQMCRWHGARDEGGHQHALRCAGGTDTAQTRQATQQRHSIALNITQPHALALESHALACTCGRMFRSRASLKSGAAGTSTVRYKKGTSLVSACTASCELAAAAAASAVRVDTRTVPCRAPVSYTHLTLPTIYSV